jgi:hypothetical protein
MHIGARARAFLAAIRIAHVDQSYWFELGHAISLPNRHILCHGLRWPHHMSAGHLRERDRVVHVGGVHLMPHRVLLHAQFSDRVSNRQIQSLGG